MVERVDTSVWVILMNTSKIYIGKTNHLLANKIQYLKQTFILSYFLVPDYIRVNVLKRLTCKYF